MRIIGGKLKGKILNNLKKNNIIRPTSNFVRENLFNIIEHGINDFKLKNSYICDLFAGTGSFGIEALSRGAKWVLFIDNSKISIKLIYNNIIKFKLSKMSKVLKKDVTDIYLYKNKILKFDLIFIDPPYNKLLIEKTLFLIHKYKWLKYNSLIILEESKYAKIKIPYYFHIINERKYNSTKVFFLKYLI